MPYSLGTVRDIPVRALKPCGLTWSGEYLWYSDGVLNQIMALDPATGTVDKRIACPEVGSDLTTVGNNLVQVVGKHRSLRVIDPVTGDLVTEVPNPRPGNVLSGLEASRYGVWFGYQDRPMVDLRSSDDWRLIAVVPIRLSVAGLTMTDRYLAYADFDTGTINLVDIDEGREVACYDVAGTPTGLTWDGSRIWYCDHATLQLRAIEVPGIAGG